MKNRNRRRLAWTFALLGATVANAQPQSEAEARAERDQAQAREAVRQAQAELEREQVRVRSEFERSSAEAQRQLAQARTELERAARDLARLSAENGVLAKGARGLYLYAGRATLGINLDLESTELGVRVVGVTPHGPAATAGVVVGDVIVAVDGMDLTGLGPPSPAQRLIEHTRDLSPGETVELRVLRDGDYRDLEVVTRERDRFVVHPQLPQAAPQVSVMTPGSLAQLRFRTPWGPFGVGAWGNLELVPLTPGLGSYFGVDSGLLVVRASENTLGFRDGDVILDISGREPTSAEHALRIMSSFEPGEMLRVKIMRDRQRETLEVQIPAADAFTEWTRGSGGV